MIEDRISELVSGDLRDAGFRLVKLSLHGSGGRKDGKILRIFAEKENYEGPDISDCQKISRMVSDVLESNDVFSGPYDLEVSSPGLERPLVALEDYKRFEGFLVNMKLKDPVDGSKKFKGRIKFDGQNIALFDEANENILETDFSKVESAKIILTDELLKSKGKMN